MSDYVQVFNTESRVEVLLHAGDDRMIALGQKMEAANPEAYMNGYNWEAFFNYYLGKYSPDILEGMGTDPEADMYVALWPLSPENEARAAKFVEIIRGLVENESELIRIVQEEGGEIQWD